MRSLVSRFRGIRRGSAGSRLLTTAIILSLLSVAPIMPAYAAVGDNIPGEDIISGVVGLFTDEDPTDTDDVFREYVFAGETIEFALWWNPAVDSPAYLFGPGSTDVYSDAPLATSWYEGLPSYGHVLEHVAAVEGYYDFDVRAPLGLSYVEYEAHWSVDDGEDDDIPGAVLGAPLESTTYTSMLDWVIDTDDVLPLSLGAGDTVTFTLTHEDPTSGADFDLHLLSPDATTVYISPGDADVVASADEIGADESLTYTAGVSGTYYLDVYAFDGAGAYTLATAIQPSRVAVTPVQGANRIATAIEAAEQAFPAGASTVIITTAFNWPDALGGSALAGALDAPILLTDPASLPSAVGTEIAALGASRVIVLGGTGAVSAPVYAALDALSGVTSIERIAGTNRYETANKVAARTIAELGAAYDGYAFVATGGNFPDALGASPIAAANGWPIYLASPLSSDNAALASVMDAAGVNEAIVLGGPGAVNATTFMKMASVIGAATRLEGDDRYATAVEVATYGVESGLSWDGVAIATGQDFPDALAGGVMQGESGSVMLLTAPTALQSIVRNTLVANKAGIMEVRFLGGVGAVSASVRSDVLSALQ